MTISLSDIRPYIGSSRHEICISAKRIMPWVEDHTEDGGYDLDPDFQRGHVWTDELRSAFVEHLIRGGDHGRRIVWNCPSYDAVARRGDAPPQLVIVDGKQRLTTLTRFLSGEVRVFGGHSIDDFDDESRRDMLSQTGALRIFMSVHALQFRRELLDLYLQLNEGVVAHAPDELKRVRALRDAAPEPRDG